MQFPEFCPGDLKPYTWSALTNLIGADAVAAIGRDQIVPAAVALAGSREPVALLARLFLLGDVVSEEELRIALPSLTSTQGLIEVDEGNVSAINSRAWRAPCQIVPYQGSEPMWFASDSGQLQGQRHADDHVMGIGGATKTLSALVSYQQGQRVLDLGTGSGFHAVLAAKAGCDVVATDISERALAYARWNAFLNDVTIDFRLGSLYEPIDDVFDVVVSNPPFVITPSSVRERLGTMEYRDGVRAGDGLVAEVLDGVGNVLADDGRAYLLANWEITDQAQWFVRPEAWTVELDSVVVQREVLDPAWYVETWLRDGGYRQDMPGYVQIYENWLRDFTERKVRAIGFGFLMVGKPEQGAPRKLHVELRGAPPSDPALYLESLWNNRVLASQAQLPMDVHLVFHNIAEHRFYVPGANEPWLLKFSQTDGYGEEILANTELAGFVSVCDGELSVGQIVDALATLLERDTLDIIDAIEDGVFHMIRLGMLVHA